MSVQRRKDNKNRVLKTGESQRKDGSYMYRYTDISGKRHTIYAPSLKSLREKEEGVNKNLNASNGTITGNSTVIDLLKFYIVIKQSRKATTLANYNSVLNNVEHNDIGYLCISHVKRTDAKKYLASLSQKGKAYQTIKLYKGVLRSAFCMACEDNLITKNPFDFQLSEFVKDNTVDREALTDQEVDNLLNFISHNKFYYKYENEIRILLGTGLRVSELYGLTVKDIDFKNKAISVNHQLFKAYNPEIGTFWKVDTPKTKKSNRIVPMSDEVSNCFKDAIKSRNLQVCMKTVDGYTDFIFSTRTGLKERNNLEKALRNIVNRYNSTTTGAQLPNITPHIFRHTFCTNMLNHGMNIKTIQYIMGHSTINITLNIYAHTTKDMVFSDFFNVINTSKDNLVHVKFA